MMNGMRMVFLSTLVLLVALTAHAQEARDPTVAPADGGSGAVGAAPSSPLGEEGVTVIVRDGKSFLVVGTRLVAPGQKVGALRLERITETEIWMRDGKTLRKVPRFAGIQRSPAVAAAGCAGTAAPNPKVQTKAKAKTKASKAKPSQVAPQVAPCESAQP